MFFLLLLENFRKSNELNVQTDNLLMMSPRTLFEIELKVIADYSTSIYIDSILYSSALMSNIYYVVILNAIFKLTASKCKF